MSKHFITGAARSVTNSVERLIELRKNHPEWDDRPEREGTRSRAVAEAKEYGFHCKPRSTVQALNEE